MKMETFIKRSISAIIIALTILVGFAFYQETKSGVEVKNIGVNQRVGQQPLLTGATTTLAGSGAGVVSVATIKDSSNCVVTTFIENAGSMAGDDIFSFKFRGSSMDDVNTLTSAVARTFDTGSSTATTSSSNIWDYVGVTNLNNALVINGDTGTSTHSTDVVERFKINDTNLRQLAVEVSTASNTASTTATVKLNAVVNCN